MSGLKPITCRAAVCFKEGELLKIEDIILDVPKDNQVRVKVVSSGVCASDAHFVWGSQQYTDFPGWYLPAVLGHEAACIVESVGPDVKRLQPGDHVLTTFMPSCGECDLCLNPRTNMCLRDNLLVLGSKPNKTLKSDGTPLTSMAGLGVYGEYALLKENQVIKIDKQVDMKKACIIGCSVCTGFFSAVNLAAVTAGSTVAIFGLGAIGLNAVIGAQYAGAKHIIGVDINPDKMESAFSFGCTEYVNSNEIGIPVDQYLLEKYGGVDYALECIGLQSTITTAFKSLSMIGTLTLIGIARNEVTISAPVGEMMSGKKIQGGFLGNKNPVEGYNQLVSMVLKGEINLDKMITKNFRLDEINDAFQMLKEGKCIRCIIQM